MLPNNNTQAPILIRTLHAGRKGAGLALPPPPEKIFLEKIYYVLVFLKDKKDT